MIDFAPTRYAVRRHHDEETRGAAGETRHAHGAHVHTNTKVVLDRLSRAIGHLNGVRGMVEEGRDCAEVLMQLAAVRSALNAVCKIILQDHLDHCIVEAVENGDKETVEELNRAIAMLLK